ncbi:MAG: hypothetical protein RSA23_01255, partial [Carnobacterium sp.]
MKKQVSILIMFIITLIVSTGCGTQKNINNSEPSEEKHKTTTTVEKERAKTSNAMVIDFDSLETI